MTREEAIEIINRENDPNDKKVWELFPEYREALDMAIQALSQEPCQLLIIKSDILLHQDDRKKWMESIKREKESGVIILPPYFEPLLVPADIEINIEQEPCDDVISRDMALEKMADYVASGYADSAEDFEEYSRIICQLPSVTQKCEKCAMNGSGSKYCDNCGQKSGKWDRSCTCSVCGQWRILESEKNGGKYKFCPNCGCRMESEDKE